MQERPGDLIAHPEALRTLTEAWRSGRLHHAWLLTGPPGIGKATLARRFAERVLGVPAGAAERSTSMTHADLLVVTRVRDEKRQRQRTEIVLDDVRPVGTFLHRTAAAGGWRVVVLDGADQMNRNASNALLKLVEEPPSRALLLLVCDSPGRLLPTLRSRCRTLRLFPLDPQAMDEVLRQSMPDLSEAERRTLISLSRGSPGRALSLAADEGVALSALAQDVLAQTGPAPGLWSYDVVEAVLRRENGFSTFFDLLLAAVSTTLRRTVLAGNGKTGHPLSAVHPVERWAEIHAELVQLKQETERLNLDKRQAVLAGLSLLGGS